MAIKKAFEPIVAFLTENQNKQVKSILPQLTELCSAKSAGGTATTVHRNEAGEVTHIFDYYFKLWLPVSHVEFGKKEGSASGFNTMCKEGVSNWSKQQREYKAAKEALLDQVAKGEVAPADIGAKLKALEAKRTTVLPYSVPGIGAAELEDALKQTPEYLSKCVAKAAEAEAKAAAAAQKAEPAQA